MPALLWQHTKCHAPRISKAVSAKGKCIIQYMPTTPSAHSLQNLCVLHALPNQFPLIILIPLIIAPSRPIIAHREYCLRIQALPTRSRRVFRRLGLGCRFRRRVVPWTVGAVAITCFLFVARIIGAEVGNLKALIILCDLFLMSVMSLDGKGRVRESGWGSVSPRRSSRIFGYSLLGATCSR